MPRHRDEDADDLPRPRRRTDDDDDRDRRTRDRASAGGISPALIVAGVAALLLFGLLVIGGLGITAYFLLSTGGPGPQQAGQPGPVAGGVGPLPARDLPPGVVSVPSVGPNVTQIVFGGGEDGAAAFVAHSPRGPGNRVDVVQTATGKSLGRVLTDVASTNGFAVSPDGKWLAVVGSAPFQGHPVTLHEVAGGQLAGTFTPYARNGPDGLRVPELVWATFTAPDRLLTVNEASGFDVWSVPELKRLAGQRPREAFTIPRVAANGFTRSPTNFALTPDGAMLALFNGTGFTFYDTRTAAATGQTEAVMKEGGSANFWGAALRADGSRFACYLSTYGPRQESAVMVWDVKTGRRLTAARPKAGVSAAGFGWWGPDHLLLWQGGVATADVMNVSTGEVVAKVGFQGTGVVGTVAPGDKLWGVTDGGLLDAGGAAPVLLKIDAPAAPRPGTRFELSSRGLVAK